MPSFQIAKQPFELEPEAVEASLRGVLPEPIQEHYVVINGRRYPPKQVIVRATGLDRADFTTHQARRVLKRLGFVAARVQPPADADGAITEGPHRGRQARVLEPYAGKWVALATPTDVLVAADTPEEVVAWLTRHERRADYGMFRVPTYLWEAEGGGPV
jgi:hypothetical protein